MRGGSQQVPGLANQSEIFKKQVNLPHLSDFEFAAHILLSLNAHIFQSGVRWSEYEVPNYLADIKVTLPSF